MKIPVEILVDVLSFFTRDDLERISIISQKFDNLVQRYFSITPFRTFNYIVIYLSSDCCIRCKFSTKEINSQLNCESLIKACNLNEIFYLLKNRSIRYLVAVFVVEMTYFNYLPDSVNLQTLNEFSQISHIWSNAETLRLFFDSYNSKYFTENFKFYPKFAIEHLIGKKHKRFNQDFKIYVDNWEEYFPLNINSSYMNLFHNLNFEIYISSNHSTNINYLEQLADFAESEYHPKIFTIQFNGNQFVQILKEVNLQIFLKIV